MILRRRVALDGVQLDSLDNRILVQSIEPAAGKDQISAVSLADGSGSRVTAMHRDWLDIVVKFSINEKSYRLEERAAVMEKVMNWAAAGGWLTVNYKTDRRVRVIAAQLPAEGDLQKRTTQYAITFRAYGVPYWQQVDANSLRLNSTSGAGVTFGVAGNAESVMDISFTNTSGGTIDTFSITCGGSSFSFAGLGLGNGETLVIDHEDNGRQCLLRIRIRGTSGGYRSAMDKRSGSDDLVVSPGVIWVSFSAGSSGTLLLQCAGRFA